MTLVPRPWRAVLTGGELRLRTPGTLAVAGPAAWLGRLIDPLDALASRAFGLRVRAATRETADIALEPTSVGAWRDAPAATGIAPSGFAGADERCSVVVTTGAAHIEAPSPEGAFRGLVTLLQFVGTTSAMPCGTIDDGPRYAWRGLSLDVARSFRTPDDVRRVVDLLALLRMNVLHLHLSDTQAWRLESPAYPLLTAGVDHYTRDELRALFAYAAERFVTIVPELDMPGHTHAAIAAYPDLAEGVDFPHPYVRYLDPDVPAAIAFAETVVSELAELVPGPFLHLGGDEAFGMPAPAYAAFTTRLAAHARALGHRVVGWQETVRGDALGGDDIAQFWISERDPFDAEGLKRTTPPEHHALVDLAAATFAEASGDAARVRDRGCRVLLSPTTPLYLDRAYAEASADPAQTDARERLGFPGYARTETSALNDWDPAAHAGADLGGAEVAGIEAAIWAETISSFDDLAFLLLPRLALVAERAWSAEHEPWAQTAARMRALAPAWERLGFEAWFRSVEVVDGARATETAEVRAVESDPERATEGARR